MTTTVPIYDAMGNVTGFQETDTPATDTAGNVTPLQLDYYRNKVREFQGILNDMDAAAAQARFIIDEDVSPDLTASMQSFIEEYEAKKGEFRAAAEALNFALQGVNAVGGNFPTLQIPGGLAGLGVIPLAAGAAVAGVLAVTAALVIWGRDWIAGVNDRLKAEVLLQSLPPEKREAVVQAIIKTDEARASSNESPLSSVAGIVKWGAIAAVAYFAFQAFQKAR